MRPIAPLEQPLPSDPVTDGEPPLENGDHLDQPTFHARYEAMPEDVRAELIGGIVYMSFSLQRPHSRHHVRVIQWLVEYQDATPGTEALDNATSILGPASEPQPDACLLILPTTLGQTREVDNYVLGAPELVVEVASSTAAVDLHAKKTDSEHAGVREYVVVVPRARRVFWFVRRGSAFQEVSPDSDGIHRSESFPGLWLDPDGLLKLDPQRVLGVLRQGLATPQHAAFVERLASRSREG